MAQAASVLFRSGQLPVSSMAVKAIVLLLAAQAASLVSAGPLNNLLADLTGHHHASSAGLADEHGHVCGPIASSFTAFFPDAVAPAHSDHFLPSVSSEAVSGHAVHQGDAAHLDQFDQSLLATRRPKMFVSFNKEEGHKEEGEEGKKEGE